LAAAGTSEVVAAASSALTGLNAGQLGASSLVSGLETGGAGCILRIIIESMLYPITLDVLHQILSKYGSVLKIVTFTKNSEYLE
jgi:hypothetical protein